MLLTNKDVLLRIQATIGSNDGELSVSYYDNSEYIVGGDGTITNDVNIQFNIFFSPEEVIEHIRRFMDEDNNLMKYPNNEVCVGSKHIFGFLDERIRDAVYNRLVKSKQGSN